MFVWTGRGAGHDLERAKRNPLPCVSICRGEDALIGDYKARFSLRRDYKNKTLCYAMSISLMENKNLPFCASCIMKEYGCKFTFCSAFSIEDGTCIFLKRNAEAWRWYSAGGRTCPACLVLNPDQDVPSSCSLLQIDVDYKYASEDLPRLKSRSAPDFESVESMTALVNRTVALKFLGVCDRLFEKAGLPKGGVEVDDAGRVENTSEGPRAVHGVDG